MNVALLLAQSLLSGLAEGQATAKSTGLLGTHVGRKATGLTKGGLQGTLLLLAHNRQNTGNSLANRTNLAGLVGISVSRDSLDAERVQLLLEVGELFGKLVLALGTQLVGLDGSGLG